MALRPAERDEVLMQIAQDVAVVKTKIEALPDHEARIRRLERWKAGVPASLVTAVVAAGAAIATALLHT